MRVYEREADYRGTGCVVALGMFDGVHIGHRQLLKTAVTLAKQHGVESLVLTFSENPMKVLFPERTPEPITTLDEKIRRIGAIGIDALIARPFTEAFAQLSAESYLQDLATRFKPLAIVIGYNYSFGRDGAGSPQTFKDMEAKYGYRTVVVEPVLFEGAPVSSTAIRALLQEGQGDMARAMLGFE